MTDSHLLLICEDIVRLETCLWILDQIDASSFADDGAKTADCRDAKYKLLGSMEALKRTMRKKQRLLMQEDMDRTHSPAP